MSDGKTYTWPEAAEDVLHRPSGTENPYGPDIGWRKYGNPGPALQYVEVDDILVWETTASVGGLTINLSVRILTANGEIIPFFSSIATVGSVGTTTTVNTRLVAGYLLSASIFAPNAGRAQVYSRLSLQRGVGSGDATRGAVLLAAYPTQFSPLSYPQSPIADSITGAGFITFGGVTTPAAGADWSLSVSANVNWAIRSICARLTTAAAVATRLARVQVFSGSLVSADVPAFATQAASLVNIYTWAPGVTGASIGSAPGFVSQGFPREIRLPPGNIIRSQTENIQAADQWDQIVVQIEQWLGT